MLHIVLLKEFYSVVISYYVYCTLQSKRKFTPMGILLPSPLKVCTCTQTASRVVLTCQSFSRGNFSSDLLVKI